MASPSSAGGAAAACSVASGAVKRLGFSIPFDSTSMSVDARVSSGIPDKQIGTSVAPRLRLIGYPDLTLIHAPNR